MNIQYFSGIIFFCILLCSCGQSNSITDQKKDTLEATVGHYTIQCDGEGISITRVGIYGVVSIIEGQVMVTSGDKLIVIDINDSGYQGMSFLANPNKSPSSFLIDHDGRNGIWDTKIKDGKEYRLTYEKKLK